MFTSHPKLKSILHASRCTRATVVVKSSSSEARSRASEGQTEGSCRTIQQHCQWDTAGRRPTPSDGPG
jgi:hypothetical protein